MTGADDRGICALRPYRRDRAACDQRSIASADVEDAKADVRKSKVPVDADTWRINARSRRGMRADCSSRISTAAA